MNPILTKLPATLLTGILLVLVLFSCKKDPYEVGIALLPSTDTLNIKVTDTCTVQAFSIRQDTIRSDKSTLLTLGSMLDPVFGRLTASLYSQVLLSSEGVDFGKSPTLDSLVLMLEYSNHYGDTLARQNVKVYELSDDLHYDSIYYTNKTLATYPTLLADQDFTPRPADSVKVYRTKLAPHLRINLSKLTNYLGNKILQAPAASLATNTAFLAFMKGLYIKSTPANSHSAILNFSITSGLSKMVVYYHNQTDPKNDSLNFDIPINASCGRFTHVDHNSYLEASTDLKQQIINRDSAQGTRQLFLQGMAGVKVKVKFPFMKNLGKGKKIAINEAMLEITNAQSDTTFAPPTSLLLLRQDSVGRIANMIDLNEGTGYFGGTYNPTARTYRFRITQHMQKIIQNAYSTHFDVYLVVDNPIASILSPNRIMLNGTDKQFGTSRFRLKVTYTILH